VTAAGTAGWLVALVVLLSLHNVLHADVRWWIWTCVTGIAMGLFALWYVPFLKRKRDRIAAGHARLAEDQSSSEYVSRDSGSKTVSSTETPGNSTRS
jgi:hypothetical protein